MMASCVLPMVTRNRSAIAPRLRLVSPAEQVERGHADEGRGAASRWGKEALATVEKAPLSDGASFTGAGAAPGREAESEAGEQTSAKMVGLDGAGLVSEERPRSSGLQERPRSPGSNLRHGGGGAAEEHEALGPSDGQLVQRVLVGERAAYEELYRRHVGYAMNLAVRIQGSSMDVEDVVHDAFIKAHACLADLRDVSVFRSWLGAIVVRLIRTRLRRRRLMSALGFNDGGAEVNLDALLSNDASPEDRAQLAQVYALLQTMPTEDRIAWTLRYVEHHRLEEVAELVGCSLATAKRRILRGQRFFAAHFVPGHQRLDDEDPLAGPHSKQNDPFGGMP